MKLSIELPKVSKGGKVSLPPVPKVTGLPKAGKGVKLPALSIRISTGPKMGLKSLL